MHIFREATPGLLVKRTTLLNLGESQLLETDSVKKCTLIWH